MLADEYLSQFEYQDVDSSIPLQAAFKTPIKVNATLALSQGDDPKKKGMVTVNWVLGESTRVEQALRLRILSNILVGSPASPLRKALIDSGIGEDIAGGGVESDLQQMIFSIGLKGMDASKEKQVEKLVLSTLQRLVKEGIDPLIIDGAMNTSEFRLREQNTGSFPRGLSLLYGTLPSWLYGGDPIEALSFQTLLNRLKTDLRAKKPVFESLIQTHLLDNTHRATVILHPDLEELSKREKIEEDRVSKMDLKGVIEQTKKLQKLQEKSDSPEDLRKLPRLSRKDLATKNTPIPSKVMSIQGVQMLEHDLATNGIIYLDLIFDLSSVPEKLLPLLPLFARCFFEMGTTTESFDVFLHRQSRESGGVSADVFTSAKWKQNGTVAKLVFQGKCLSDQLESMLALFEDALLSANFDNKDRFIQMLLDEKTDFETSRV
jgi:Zn-dependent M16 (insulinase) family peptidase